MVKLTRLLKRDHPRLDDTNIEERKAKEQEQLRALEVKDRMKEATLRENPLF